jgi:hypothetical protein
MQAIAAATVPSELRFMITPYITLRSLPTRWQVLVLFPIVGRHLPLAIN